MKACGIVVEYNPFHNGHKYHLEKSKELSGADLIIAVMSGNFLQRGEPAILNKWLRAKMAVEAGVDLVIELPTIYSTESAEFFASGAIDILSTLKCKSIVFGSEIGEIDKLQEIVDYSMTEEFSSEIKKLLKEGMSYPNAMKIILENQFGEDSLNPNNILGIEYLKAIGNKKAKIKPLTIKREKVGYHELGFTDKIASATGIRKLIFDKEYKVMKKLLPEASYEIIMENLDNIAKLEDYFDFIKFRVINDKSSLIEISDMEEGLWNRVYEKMLVSKSYKDFMEKFTSKRYTLSRTNRILVHILLNIKKNQRLSQTPFIRALAFNDEGAKYIKYLKKEFNVKVMSSNKNVEEYVSNIEIFQEEIGRDEIYKLAHEYEDYKFAYKKL